MIWKSIVFLTFALNVLSKELATSEQYIKIKHKDHPIQHGELSHIGDKEPEHHEVYAWAYPSYEFSYKVHDPHTHDIKGQEESRDGDKVKGEYWLIQPDGYKRTVKYHADKHSGFHADVHLSKDDYHHEDKKEEGNEEKKEEEHFEDKPVKESVESHDHVEKKEDEEEEEEKEKKGDGVRDGEESRGHEEVGRWIHDRHWGYRGYKHGYEMKYDQHDDDKNSYGHKNAQYATMSELGHKHRYNDYERHQESRARPAYRALHSSLQKRKAIVRENYANPRYYRHSQ